MAAHSRRVRFKENAMRAIDVMTPSVICARPDMTVQNAAKLLVEHRISGMPVVDEKGDLVGIVSEGDLLRRVETSTQKRSPWWLDMLSSTRSLAGEFVREHSRLIGDVMRTDVVTVDAQTALVDIADLMEKHGIKRVPVMNEGKLVGIVSRANLVRALASAPPPARNGSSVSDSEIAAAIVSALRDRRWALSKESVIVVNGVAHLWGLVRSEEEEKALCIAAAEVSGVRQVRAHLAYPTCMPLM
jgi:CBS-domain-containing membrane protein